MKLNSATNLYSTKKWNVSDIFSVYIIIIVVSMTTAIMTIGYINVKQSTYEAHENFSQDELSLLSGIFNIYLDNHIAALQDHAKSPIIINAVMNSEQGSHALEDVLGELRVIGKNASLSILDIDGMLIQKDHEVSTLDKEAVTHALQVVEQTIDHYYYFRNPDENTTQVILGLMVPILYNGLAEGVLLAELEVNIRKMLNLGDSMNGKLGFILTHKKNVVFSSSQKNATNIIEKPLLLSNNDSLLTLTSDISYVSKSLRQTATTTLLLSLLFMIAFLLFFRFIGRKLFIEPGVIIQNERQKTGELNKQLTSANEDLNQFVYIASHDLKSPLLAITQLSEWVVEDCEDLLPSDSKKHLRMLSDRTKRMKHLLEDLLEYSRIGRFNYEIELLSFCELAENAYEPLNKSANFSFSCTSTIKDITLHRVPLEIVLRNCFSNAIKHHHTGAGNISASCQQIDDHYLISVTDDGPGIEEELQNKAFEMFQTLKPRDEVEGSGMGLAIIKKIVESYGGKVAIASSPGKGTTIETYWPVIRENDNE